jgi:ubiquinone/menaquinone biosynthesis C-methylase UbiE
MSSELKSIHEFDINLICEYYSLVERQGPGSDDVTLKALSFIEGLDESSKIIDLGCGTGGQTMTLGSNTKGEIIGLDLFPLFIDLFNKNAIKNKLNNRVKGRVGSMGELPFSENYFDLIWSEGAIYNLGFESGLNYFNKFLKKNGYVAVSEVSWFTNERPKEIDDFWMDAYPEIDTIPNKLQVMQNAGFIPVASFILPEYCWVENFYSPQVTAQQEFLLKNKGNKWAEDFIENQRYEERLYMKYKDYYGYVFYIGKKNS